MGSVVAEHEEAGTRRGDLDKMGLPSFELEFFVGTVHDDVRILSLCLRFLWRVVILRPSDTCLE